MDREKYKDKLDKMFDEDAKIKAFDKIAEKFYYGNFGSTSKADVETLMFSLYIEQILKKEQDNMVAYSDYSLSKELGITQSKVSNLKVRKELQYPYEDFKWEKSFERVSKNFAYEDGKIKMHIPDKNLYLELKNAIETSGGYVEVQLTNNLLQVKLPYFIDLLIAISGDEDRENIRKALLKRLKEINNDEELQQYTSFGKALKAQTPNMLIDIIGEFIPVFGGAAKVVANNVYVALNKSK